MSEFSDAEIADLRCLVRLMIPASDRYKVPAADDPLIFADIIKSFGRDLPAVHSALADLAARSAGSFAALDTAQQAVVAEGFREQSGTPLMLLHRTVLLCYYRDDRVMISLDQEPRAPFPKGHVVEQGDWSLLDQVKQRPKMWRDAPP